MLNVAHNLMGYTFENSTGLWILGYTHCAFTSEDVWKRRAFLLGCWDMKESRLSMLSLQPK